MKKIILSSALMAISMGAMADATQTVTIDGESVDKQVASLSFDGDKVAMTFSNGDIQKVDLESLIIAMDYSGIVGIVEVENDSEFVNGKIYNMAGQYVGNNVNALSKGIYIVNGKKIAIR